MCLSTIDRPSASQYGLCSMYLVSHVLSPLPFVSCPIYSISIRLSSYIRMYLQSGVFTLGVNGKGKVVSVLNKLSTTPWGRMGE
jgi:hypothetical protein